MEKRRGENSCKIAVFSQDKWGGLSPAWKLPFWKLSSYGCLSGETHARDRFMAMKDVLNSKGLYKR